jgi:hypothetical protein
MKRLRDRMIRVRNIFIGCVKRRLYMRIIRRMRMRRLLGIRRRRRRGSRVREEIGRVKSMEVQKFIISFITNSYR